MSHEFTRYSERREVAILWFGFLGPLLAWKIQLMVNYILVPYACTRQLGYLIDIASLTAFALAIGAGWVAWTRWRQVRESGPYAARSGRAAAIETELSRTRFMAAAGVAFGAFAALLILAQWLPGLLLSPCWS